VGTTWQQVDRLCRAEPEGRVVRTRHSDPMLLSEFLLTRVVEVAVHGLDLADALGREPVTREEALDAGRPDIRWLTLRRERRQRQLSRCGGASMVQVHIPKDATDSGPDGRQSPKAYVPGLTRRPEIRRRLDATRRFTLKGGSHG
jgi:hypothetical protein